PSRLQSFLEGFVRLPDRHALLVDERRSRMANAEDHADLSMLEAVAITQESRLPLLLRPQSLRRLLPEMLRAEQVRLVMAGGDPVLHATPDARNAETVDLGPPLHCACLRPHVAVSPFVLVEHPGDAGVEIRSELRPAGRIVLPDREEQGV